MNNFSNGAGAKGTIELAGNNNTYTGNTNIFSGTLLLDSNSSINNTTSLNLNNDASLKYLGVTNITIAALAGSGTLDLTGLTLTTGGGDTTSIFTGDLLGTGNLIKIGTGTLSLDGTTTYSGNTQIEYGTLEFGTNGSIGNIQVSSGASLKVSNSNLTAGSIVLNGNGANGVGALTTNGTSTVTSTYGSTGAVNLATNSLIYSTGQLTINSDINATTLTNSGVRFHGDGAVTINGSIGNTNALGYFKTSNVGGSTSINGLGVATSGDQVYNNPLYLLANNTTLSSTMGAITANSTIDMSALTYGVNNDTSNLLINSFGNTTFNGAVGSQYALTTLTTNAASTGINGSAITTTGSQKYNNIVTLGNDAVLTDIGDGVITMNNGVNSPNANLTLAGDNGSNTFNLGGNTVALNNLIINGGINASFVNLSGNFNVNNINIQGNANSINSLVIKTTSPSQAWTLTALNSGNIVGVANTSFNFINMNNLTGGDNSNAFTLSGGTLNGYITGGSGYNILTADNVSNVWTLQGTNSGTVTGITGFSNIANLTGGNNNNYYNIMNGSSIGGLITTGTNLNATNTLDYTNYTGNLNLTDNGRS